MYDKILVPLDGSELAEVTLVYTPGLAARLHSSITLVYVTAPDDVTSPYMYECYLKETAKRVKALAEKRAAETGNGEIKVDYKVLKGDAAEEIVDYANKAKIDLIVMSTQGHSGVKRWALGNVANKVSRATRKQVFLIRAKGAKTDVDIVGLSKVLVPVDGSRESEYILRYVTHMATELDLEVTLLHVWALTIEPHNIFKQLDKEGKRRENYIKRLEARLKQKGVNVNSVFKKTLTGEEAEEIIKLAEEGGFSLVAMTTHGRSGVGRWIFGSNAEKVLAEGSTPLLLVRPPRRKTTKAD